MHCNKLLQLVLFFLSYSLKCFRPLLSYSLSSLEFELHSLPIQDLSFLGDSHITDEGLVLIETTVPIPSSGRVFYNKPIQFLDPISRKTRSFITTFTFYIELPSSDDSSSGDGFAFLLSPDIHFVGNPGSMGLTDSTSVTKIKFLAVEFDTKKDKLFKDPDDNHVGLDINSLQSVQYETAYSVGIDLSSGEFVTAWIEYKDEPKKLDVFLNNYSFKPDVPLLSIDIDLYDYIDEIMYVGFSASTRETEQLTRILQWKFSISELSLPPPPPPEYIFPRPSTSGRNHHPGLVIGLAITAAMTFCAITLIFSWIGVKRWKLRTKKLKNATHYVELRKHKPSREHSQETQLSTPNTETAVDSFHSNKGGDVFKTILKLKSLNHPNLVNIMDCSLQNGEVTVEYELDGLISLDKVLFQEYKSVHPLKWNYRYKIASGLASAVTYLHEKYDLQVSHMDIRCSNVLLDEFYNPKLTNFGSVTTGDHKNCYLPMHITGIMEYLAPEYLQDWKATEATDVYSYGVVILELACGRRPIETKHGKKRFLVDWVWKLHSEGKIKEAADRRLNGEFDEEQVMKVLLIGLSCANPDSAQRPIMMRVFQILNNEAESMIVPKVKPSLTFSNTLPSSMDDILSDNERCKKNGQLQIPIN